MDFTSFLDACRSPEWWQSRLLVYCTSNEYAALFFSLFIDRCKKNGIGTVQVVDLAQAPIDSTTAQFSSSFLGLRNYYWLKNISDLDAKKRTYWTTYLQAYQGPHCLIFFCDKALACPKSESVVKIEIPDLFDAVTAVPVFNCLVPNDVRRCSLVVRALFKNRRKVSLDSISLLTYYMAVLGPDLELFLTTSLDSIIVPDSSLFDLSKYFFARNAQAFFRSWQSMSILYGELFWIAYWGDIFWRAYHFAYLSGQGKHEQAKKFAPRLPFTYIQGGWRHVSLVELKESLNYIYKLDTDIKNGVQGYPFLELLYLKFFLRQFDARQVKSV